MSDTGRLVVYKIIGWTITTVEIKGGARAPTGYAPEKVGTTMAEGRNNNFRR